DRRRRRRSVSLVLRRAGARRGRGDGGSRMVRLLVLFFALSGCTLIVQNELDSCPDLVFTDGSPNGGQHFQGGVTAPSFRGPAFPPACPAHGSPGAAHTTPAPAPPQ